VAGEAYFAPGQAGMPVPKNDSRVLTDRNSKERSFRSLEHVLGIRAKEVQSGLLRAHPGVVQRGAGLCERVFDVRDDPIKVEVRIDLLRKADAIQIECE
jgi:hypothetical protein